MKYALVGNVRKEAAKGLVGVCPFCGDALLARCGKVKVNHWAHKKKFACDNWWENETEWHRSWKNQYPIEWQEIVMFDERTKEKHIADVKTPDGLIIEFQHSKISELERKSRESFYKKIIWVVDGSRRKRDSNRFLSGLKSYGHEIQKGVYEVDYLDGCLPQDWIACKKLMVFDFEGIIVDNGLQESYQRIIYIVVPNTNNRVFITEMKLEVFINKSKDGSFLKFFEPTPLPIKSKTSVSLSKPINRESKYVYDLRKGVFKTRRRF